MFGFGLLIAAISFVLFAAGFLAGALLLIAISIKLEDRAAVHRLMTTRGIGGSILLHEEPQGFAARRVRCLIAGQSNSPSQMPGNERHERARVSLRD